MTPYLCLALCCLLVMKCFWFIGGAADVVSCRLYCKLSLTLSLSLYLSFSHTYTHILVLPPPPHLSLPPCVWERQCLHTMGAQAGCLGNLQALPHSGKKRALQLWIAAVTRLVRAPSRSLFNTHIDTNPHTARLPMTPTPTLCQPNTLKCILFQNGALGWRGWVPLILEPGTPVVS